VWLDYWRGIERTTGRTRTGTAPAGTGNAEKVHELPELGGWGG